MMQTEITLEITEEDIRRALPKMADSCPIVFAAERMFPEAVQIYVWSSHVFLCDAGKQPRTYGLGTEGIDFMKRFDGGESTAPASITAMLCSDEKHTACMPKNDNDPPKPYPHKNIKIEGAKAVCQDCQKIILRMVMQMNNFCLTPGMGMLGAIGLCLATAILHQPMYSYAASAGLPGAVGALAFPVIALTGVVLVKVCGASGALCGEDGRTDEKP